METKYPLRKRRLILFISIAAFSAIISCKKTKNYENIDLITGKNWHLESRQMDGVEISDSCDLDNVLRFENASDFSLDLGTKICSPEVEAQKSPTGWKLTEQYTVMRLKYKFTGNKPKGNTIEYWKIIELSDTSLIVKDATAENSKLIPEIRTYK